jgi:hypothetical protein
MRCRYGTALLPTNAGATSPLSDSVKVPSRTRSALAASPRAAAANDRARRAEQPVPIENSLLRRSTRSVSEQVETADRQNLCGERTGLGCAATERPKRLLAVRSWNSQKIRTSIIARPFLRPDIGVDAKLADQLAPGCEPVLVSFEYL